jgi:DNA-directed RNA polymerase subunit RPC12/RpoP
MSNATWVCFDCRQTFRRGSGPDEVVRCPHCGVRCQCLGRKIAVPARDRLKAWQTLREDVRLTRARYEERRRRRAVRGKHNIEKKIAEIERRLPNASRDKLLRELPTRLGRG